jgi:hypothetical protein
MKFTPYTVCVTSVKKQAAGLCQSCKVMSQQLRVHVRRSNAANVRLEYDVFIFSSRSCFVLSSHKAVNQRTKGNKGKQRANS